MAIGAFRTSAWSCSSNFLSASFADNASKGGADMANRHAEDLIDSARARDSTQTRSYFDAATTSDRIRLRPNTAAVMAAWIRRPSTDETETEATTATASTRHRFAATSRIWRRRVAVAARSAT